jgi:hypothetical protein
MPKPDLFVENGSVAPQVKYLNNRNDEYHKNDKVYEGELD